MYFFRDFVAGFELTKLRPADIDFIWYQSLFKNSQLQIYFVTTISIKWMCL